MKSNKNFSNINYIKCENCGSSNFVLGEDGVHRCAYCNSSMHIESKEKDEFIAFLNSFTTSNKRLHIIRATKSKKQFLKQAQIELAMNADSPDDILDAKFGEVIGTYSYYVVFDCDFNFIKISDSLSVGRDLTRGVETSTYQGCLKIEEGNENDEFCKVFLNNIKDYSGDIVFENIQSKKIADLNLQTPNKDLVEKIIEENISKLKQKIIQKTDKPDVSVIPCIKKIDLYIVPQYSLEYEYKGQKHTIVSFAYNSEMMTGSPYKNLSKKLKKQSIIAKSISYGFCAFAVVFALIHLLFIRSQMLSYFDFGLAGLSAIVFFVTHFISKKIIIKTKKKHFEKRREYLTNYFSENKQNVTRNDYEIINNYLRWY